MVKAHLYTSKAENLKRTAFVVARVFEEYLKRLQVFGGECRALVLVAARNSTFDDSFSTALIRSNPSEFIAMLEVDSEDPVKDIERTWDHLKLRDNWDKPQVANDERVFFMTTSMETWIVADCDTLKETHYGRKLQENALPPLNGLENQEAAKRFMTKLVHATRECSNAYKKGRRSFADIAALSVAALKSLPSFARMVRILDDKL